MALHSFSAFEYRDRQPVADQHVFPQRVDSLRPLHGDGPSGVCESRPPHFGVGNGPRPAAPDSGMISIPLPHMNIVLSVSAAKMTQQPGVGLAIHANGDAGPAAAARSKVSLAQLPDATQLATDDPTVLKAPRDLGLAELVAERHSADPIVERLSRALEAAESSDHGFGNLYADAVRLAIVTRLLSLRPDPEPKPEEQPARTTIALPKWRWKRVVEYVDSHLDETISLADMAAVAGLSRMYFAAQFRAATGIRPHEFLLRRRIDRAKQMLAETESTLVDVALSVGFQNQAHFTTVFRRFVGETPYRWRSCNRTDGAEHVANRAQAPDGAYWRQPPHGSSARPIQIGA
jgi:AraC-like DNA-binding protein